MNKIVNLRKIGNFYNAYEDDAYVLHYCLDYTVSNGRVGFPVNALGKVQNKLEEYKVNYKIIEKDEVKECKDYKKNNNYDKCYQEGIKSSERKRNDDELKEKIKRLSPEKVDEILKYIEKMLDEE